MDNKTLEQKVRNINWEKYLEPKYFDSKKMSFSPERLIKALICLISVSETDASFGFGQEFLDAIGNNHRGTYYPATSEAIDLIIEIEKYSENENSRNCANAILNDLFYFQLELGSKDKQLYDFINNSIREKLKPYSDKYL